MPEPSGLAEILGLMGVDSTPKTPAMPFPAAQAMELQKKWADYHTSAPLNYGDLCVEKPGLFAMNDRPVYVLWAPLDKDNYLHRKMIDNVIDRSSPGDLNCIVARLNYENEIGWFAFDINRLMPLPADLAAG